MSVDLDFDTGTEAVFDDVQEQGTVLDDDERYVLKVVRLESSEGQFGPSIKWVFNVVRLADKQLITRGRDSDEPYEWFQYSDRKLKVGTKGHQWAEAFLDREIGVGESGAQIARDLIGKKAIVTTGPSKTGKLTIARIRPMGGAGGNGAAKPARPAQPAMVAAPKAAPKPARTYDDVFGDEDE